MKGLVHIYTGDGKGKTTAAVGLGVRACGRGLRVLMVQFLKGAETGEIHSLKMLEPGFVLHRAEEIKKFTWNMNEAELRRAAEIQQGILNYAADASLTGNWDIIILDEVMGALATGMLKLGDIIRFIEEKPGGLELVLTGRNAPPELLALADYISEIKALRHPMEKGIPARIGIES